MQNKLRSYARYRIVSVTKVRNHSRYKKAHPSTKQTVPPPPPCKYVSTVDKHNATPYQESLCNNFIRSSERGLELHKHNRYNKVATSVTSTSDKVVVSNATIPWGEVSYPRVFGMTCHIH